MIVLEKMVVDHYSMPEKSIEVMYLKNTISVLGNYVKYYPIFCMQTDKNRHVPYFPVFVQEAL